MNLFNLFAKLTLDKSDYEKGLEEAKQEGKNFAGDTKNVVAPEAIAAFSAIAAAVVALATKIYQLWQQTLTYADTVSDMAAKFGVTTASISEMQYIADQSSTSIEGMTSAMSMLFNRVKEGSEAFQRLGIDVRDSNGNFKAMDELFYETVGALNDVEDANERNALMLETFGESAFSVGEVVRKTSEELERMRQEAHELGIVMNEETVQFASDFNDALAVLRLQGQSALASLISGDEDAEEKLQDFFDRVLEIAEENMPRIISFSVRLFTNAATALIRLAPRLVGELAKAIVEVVFDPELWIQTAVDLFRSIAEAVVNGFGVNLTRWFDRDAEFVDFNVGQSVFAQPQSMELNQSSKQEVVVKVQAEGETAISQQSAEETARALAPILDEILGGV